MEDGGDLYILIREGEEVGRERERGGR